MPEHLITKRTIMKQLSLDFLWNEANYLLQKATNNINDQKLIDAKDTCMNCKYSMQKFLQGYLRSNGVEPIKDTSIEVLFRQCQSIDDKFATMDISSIGCRYELINEDHCTESNKLEDCIATVKEIKEITY